MNYYERHIGDYLKDTAHLSLLEHGIYTRLMDVYYTREGAIPAADAARLIGARSKDERAALQAVLAEFFVLVDGAYRQDRCEREISRYQDKQAKAKRSAEARWNAAKPQSDGNANASADAMRTHSDGNAHQTPDTRHQSPDPIPNTDTHTSTDVVRASDGGGDQPSTPTMAGAVCITLRAKGIASVNPSHPDLLALIAAGIDVGAFASAAEVAVERGHARFPYVLGVVKGQQADAQRLATNAANSPPPQAGSRKDRQLQTAAALTGAPLRQPTKTAEVIDVNTRVIAS